MIQFLSLWIESEIISVFFWLHSFVSYQFCWLQNNVCGIFFIPWWLPTQQLRWYTIRLETAKMLPRARIFCSNRGQISQKRDRVKICLNSSFRRWVWIYVEQFHVATIDVQNNIFLAMRPLAWSLCAKYAPRPSWV